MATSPVMRLALCLSVALLAAPPAAHGDLTQRAGARQEDRQVPDSSALLRAARAAQSRFERRRTRYLPITLASYGGSCDERVGRLCVWYGEGEWLPKEERPEISAMRDELLLHLDGAAAELPGDGWILGQRVWYRAEAEDLEGALAVARVCGTVERWWCRALQGFALHRLGRFTPALETFEDALTLMPPEDAREWRVPRRAVDARARALLDELPPDSLDAALERLWRLADPLYLVAGNDRRTAHYARWTVATLREEARNPFHLTWGRDLEALTVRNGWELGWERYPSRDMSRLDGVVGHKHPQGRDFMPSGETLTAPAGAPAEELIADARRPRSLYAPSYAPVVLPMEGQVAVFPRGDRSVVVATHYLPEDTTLHAGHDHRRPWMEPGAQADLPERAGLFLVSMEDSATFGETHIGGTTGVLAAEVGEGEYLLSVEAWSPAERRAGRRREGIAIHSFPPDVAMLSDLLLLEAGGPDPPSLEAAVNRALIRPHVRPGDNLAVAWEVVGLGRRPQQLSFHLTVERSDRGLWQRAGELLHIVSREPAVSLAWEEPGPSRLGPSFRRVSLALPHAQPGRFRVRLELRLPGRTRLVSEREFRVLAR